MKENILYKKTFLFVICADGVGGAEKQSILYAQYLKSNYNCRIKYWNFLKGSKELAKLFKNCNISCDEIIYPGSKSNINQIIKLAYLKILQLIVRPDVVMSYTIIPNIFMNLISGKNRSRVCIWNQRDEGILNYEYAPKYFKRSLENTSWVISNNKIGLLYLKNNGLENNNYSIINNGLDLNLYENNNSGVYSKYNIQYDFVCCMIANLHPNKDHETLIKGWRIVIDHFNKLNKTCILLIAGGLKATSSIIEKLIIDLGLVNNIVVLGFINDPMELLNASTLYLHCSKSEGISNSILEAMASKKSIVATDIESIRSTVSDENEKFLYKGGDYSELAKNIISLLTNERERQKMEIANYNFVKQHFSLKNYNKNIDIVINKLLTC